MLGKRLKSLFVALVWIPFFGVLFLPLNSKADQPNPFYSADVENSARVSGHFNFSVNERWSQNLLQSTTPTIAGNTIYYNDYSAADTKWHLYARDLYSSQIRWDRPYNYFDPNCTPVVSSGLVYSCDADVLVMNPESGAVIKTIQSNLGHQVRYINILGDLLLTWQESPVNKAEAFSITSGQSLWSFATDRPLGTVVAEKGRLFYIYNNGSFGNYRAVDALNGNQLWQRTFGKTAGPLSYDQNTDTVYDPWRNHIFKWSDGSDYTVTLPLFGRPFFSADKVNYYYTESNGTTRFVSLSLATGQYLQNIPGVISASIASNQLLVDDKVYFVSSKNIFYETDLAGNILNSKPLNSRTTFSGNILIDHGRLVVVDSNTGKISFYDPDQTVTVGAESFVLRSPYVDYGHTYLGQLHAHWKPDNLLSWQYYLSDPFTPAVAESKYKEKGYDFIALTEHNQLTTDPNVGILHIKDAEEDTQPVNGNHILAVGVSNSIDETRSDQERIDQVINQGGVPILAHPNSKYYPFPWENVFKLKNYKIFDIYSTASDSWEVTTLSGLVNKAYAIDKFDSLLSASKQVFASADDDSTPGAPGFDGGAVVVNSSDLSQPSIMENLRSGNFYAIQGSKAPRIKVTTSASVVSVTSNQVGSIKFIGQYGKTLKQVENVSAADYQVVGNEKYVRAEVTADGLISWSQPVTVEKVIAANTPFGKSKIECGDFLLETNTTEMVKAAKSANQTCPQGGCITPVYSFETTGEQVEQPKLTFKYSADMPAKLEKYLSVFTFNSASNTWEKVTSSVDSSAKTVSAVLPHFSGYVLSLDLPQNDTTAPTVIIETPSNNSTVDLSASNQLSIKSKITDNQAVDAATVTLDGRTVCSSNAPESEYACSVDLTSETTGSHQIKVVASDLSGNQSEAVSNFTLTNGSYLLSEIVNSSITKGANKVDFSLSVNNLNNLSEIRVYQDGLYIETLSKPTTVAMVYSLDTTNLKPIDHTASFEAISTNGQIKKTDITFSLKPVIPPPPPVKVCTNPLDSMGIVGKILKALLKLLHLPMPVVCK